MWHDIKWLQVKEKPVYICIAASGGYYIVSAGDYIVCEPLTITGSIGVFRWCNLIYTRFI